MEQIICENLAIGYDGKELLRDINFSVKNGDYLCIIGENVQILLERYAYSEIGGTFILI